MRPCRLSYFGLFFSHNKLAETVFQLVFSAKRTGPKSARLCTRDREHARSCFAARRRQRALWSADRQARSLRRARWPPATRGQWPARVGWRCQVSPAGDEAADSFPSSSSVTVGTATTAAACQFLPCFSRLAPARAPWTASPATIRTKDQRTVRDVHVSRNN